MMGVSDHEIARITKRRDFIAVKNGARSNKTLAHSSAFVLQAAPRTLQAGKLRENSLKKNPPQKHSIKNPPKPDTSNRFGFTVTKRVGNSVVRNRIRRRMREAVRLHAGKILSKHSITAFDFVMIGREQALHIPFGQMVAELTSGLDHIAKKSPKQLRKVQ